eukprot:m.274617 g.274617  ORF g.274617 m.274617 type:complete len:1134 (+) comp17690_c0_seq4:185-3586(+)
MACCRGLLSWFTVWLLATSQAVDINVTVLAPFTQPLWRQELDTSLQDILNVANALLNPTQDPTQPLLMLSSFETAAVILDFNGSHPTPSSAAFEIDLHSRHDGSPELAEQAVAAIPTLATALDRMFALMLRLGWQKAAILSESCSLLDYKHARTLHAAAGLRKVELVGDLECNRQLTQTAPYHVLLLLANEVNTSLAVLEWALRNNVSREGNVIITSSALLGVDATWLCQHVQPELMASCAMYVLDVEYYRGPITYSQQLNVTTSGHAPAHAPSQLEAHIWDWVLFLVTQRDTLLLDPEDRAIGLLKMMVEGVQLQSASGHSLRIDIDKTLDRPSFGLRLGLGGEDDGLVANQSETVAVMEETSVVFVSDSNSPVSYPKLRLMEANNSWVPLASTPVVLEFGLLYERRQPTALALGVDTHARAATAFFANEYPDIAIRLRVFDVSAADCKSLGSTVLAQYSTAALWGSVDSTCTADLLQASNAVHTPHFFLSADTKATGGLNSSSAFRMDVSPTSYGLAAAAFATYLKRNCLLLITAEDVTDLTKLLMAEITAQLDASNLEYFVHTFSQKDQVDGMVAAILNGNSSSVLVFLDSAETRTLLARAAQVEAIAQSTLAWTILPSAGDLDLFSERVRTAFDRQIFTANRQIPATPAAKNFAKEYLAFDAGLDQSALPLTTVERSVVDALHLLYQAADQSKYVFGLDSDVQLARRTLTSAIASTSTVGLLQDPLIFNAQQELESQLDLQAMVSGRWFSLARYSVVTGNITELAQRDPNLVSQSCKRFQVITPPPAVKADISDNIGPLASGLVAALVVLLTVFLIVWCCWQRHLKEARSRLYKQQYDFYNVLQTLDKITAPFAAPHRRYGYVVPSEIPESMLEVKFHLSRGNFGAVQLALLHRMPEAPRLVAPEAVQPHQASSADNHLRHLTRARTLSRHASAVQNHLVEHLVPGLALESSLPLPDAGSHCRQPLPVAVKQIRRISSEEDRDRLAAEILCLAQFRGHRHIVQLVGAVTLSEGLTMVVEYCSRGSLELFLKAAKRQSFDISWPFRSRLLAQIALGVKAITDFGLVHKDLAARNVLLTRQLTPKIADMELCCYENLPGNEMIPLRWIDPEAHLSGNYTPACDVWSYGVLA